MSPSSSSSISILLLADEGQRHANTVLDHIEAFTNMSKHDVSVFNPRYIRDNHFLSFDEFDAIVIHYTLFCISESYLPSKIKEKIRDYQGLKIQFIQDDYRWVDQIATEMRFMRINVLFTLYPEDKISKVWTDTRLPGVTTVHTLTGYVPDSLVGIVVPSLNDRSIDVGYRGRALPFWLGELGQEKVWIGEGFLTRASKYGIRCNIGWQEKDRIYGDAWVDFIKSCKATLGTESGASITDFDGSLQKRVDAYLADHPEADFREVQREILAQHENVLPLKTISPRMFEAIALRSALVLFPGDYSGILQPNVHYIPLEKDFSNMDEVVAKLNDLSFLNRIVERAYRDIVASGRYSYRAFADEFDQMVEKNVIARDRRKRPKVRYRLAQLERLAALFVSSRPIHPSNILARTHPLYRLFFGTYHLKVGFALLLSLLSIISISDSLVRRMFWCTWRTLLQMPPTKVIVFLNELMYLGAVRRMQNDRYTEPSRWTVLTEYDENTRRVGMFSLIMDQRQQLKTDKAHIGDARDAFWGKFEHEWSLGNISKIVWEHPPEAPQPRICLWNFMTVRLTPLTNPYMFGELTDLPRRQSR